MAEGNITVTVNARADDVQALVDEVERLRAEVARLRAAITGAMPFCLALGMQILGEALDA